MNLVGNLHFIYWTLTMFKETRELKRFKNIPTKGHTHKSKIAICFAYYFCENLSYCLQGSRFSSD